MVTTMRASLALGLVAALLGAGAAARAAGFETLCARALTSDAPEWFEGQLARIDALLETGSLDEAAAQHGLAPQRLPRTADISVSAKCVGRALYRRWYEQGRRIRRVRAEAPEADRRARLEGAVARAGTSAAPGPEAIADTVAAEPAAYGYAIAWLRGLGEQTAHERAEGRFVLEEEEAEARAGAAAADVLVSRAKARTERALAEEQAAFAGDASDADERLAAQTQGAEAMASAVAGLAPEPGRAQTRGQLVRGRRVRRILREAGAWAQVAGSQAEASVRARAHERAEVFRAAGADDAYAFAVRDDHYALAVDLYGLAGAEAERDAAEQARRALRPDLAREAGERDAAIAAARERLEQDAEGMREAAKEMEKSDAEKQSFDDEFDEAFGDMEDFFDE